jgi:hypothetical protein
MGKFRMLVYSGVVSSIFLFCATCTYAQFRWPKVAPLRKSYVFQGLDKGAEPKVDLIIRSASGKPLYRLLCHSGDYAGGPGDEYEGEEEDFTGVLGCHLLPLYFQAKNYGSLLFYDPLDRTVHFDRASLSPTDVIGKCADYPEYGAVRQFHLRGMEINFRYRNIIFSKATTKNGVTPISSFRFDIEVKRDPSAVTAIAAPVNVDRPRALPDGLRDCQDVVHWHVPGEVTAAYLRKNGLEPPYEEIRAVQKKQIFRKNEFELSIESVSGQEAYLFSCFDRDPWGIECGLFLPGNNLNLLADSVDPYSHLERSTFLENQLQGACAAYPGWGSKRTFELRHMSILVDFTNSRAVSSGPRTRRMQSAGEAREISVNVQPDPSAESPVATPPEYAYWGFLPIRNACATPVSAPR